MKHARPLTILLALSTGCFESTRIVGDDSVDGGGSGGSDAASFPEAGGWPVRTGCGEGEPLDPEVTWDGWIEEMTFSASGTDRVRIEVHEDGAGGYEGFALFGDAPPVAAPTSAASCDWAACYLTPPTYSAERIWDGVQYSLGELTVTSNRLSFLINRHEPWEAYCALLEPLIIDGSPSCVDSEVRTDDVSCFMTTDGVERPLDCCRFSACPVNSACQCDADGCHASTGFNMQMDLFIEGNTANGSLDGINVHLTRVTEP